jgi:hypothetical protein
VIATTDDEYEITDRVAKRLSALLAETNDDVHAVAPVARYPPSGSTSTEPISAPLNEVCKTPAIRRFVCDWDAAAVDGGHPQLSSDR